MELDGSSADTLTRAKKAIEASGGKFNGDEVAGTFSGKGVQGSYALMGKGLTVFIGKKPFFVSEATVESKIRSFFD